jgi:hypothetical protein
VNNYYRLKVFDRNGKTAFSNAIQVKDSALTMVYPVPAGDILYIQTNSNTQFFIIDESGRI